MTRRAIILTKTERAAIVALIEASRAAWIAAEDSEEFEGDHGRTHAIDSQNFDCLTDALDALDELPDDKPDQALSPAGRAQWALRRLLEREPSTNTAEPGGDDPHPEGLAELTPVDGMDWRETMQRMLTRMDDAGRWPAVCDKARAGPSHQLICAVDDWFSKNTGLGGCSDNDVTELAAIFATIQPANQPAAPASRGAEDAARFRWLVEDHPDAHVRESRQAICERLPVMSYSAACTDIDAARAKQEGK